MNTTINDVMAEIIAPATSELTDPEILIIRDAFEAVTNGMHNPEALQALDSDVARDDLMPWKYIIHAIQSFYDRDFPEMESYLSMVDDKAPPAQLKSLLFHMSGLKAFEHEPCYREESLLKKITRESSYISNVSLKLRKALQQNAEVFAETASLIIKELKSQNFEASRKLALWSFRECLAREIDEEPLADNILMIFGQAEGLRLIALGLLEEDPGSSLICFMRSLVNRLSERNITSEETQAFLDVLCSLANHCSTDDSVISEISELVRLLESEIRINFSISTAAESDSAVELLVQIREAFDTDELYDYSICKPEAESPVQTRAPVQLELF